MIKSQALEINLARTRVEVAVDPHYLPIQNVMEQHFGLREAVHSFLTEVSHPYKNWQYIVSEARSLAFNHFHLFLRHKQGNAAAQRIIELFFKALQVEKPAGVNIDAADNLLLYLQKIIKEAGSQNASFFQLAVDAMEKMTELADKLFFLFVKSYYSIKSLVKMAKELNVASPGQVTILRSLLERHLRCTYNYWKSIEDPRQWFAQQCAGEKLPPVLNDAFAPITHQAIDGYLLRLEDRSAREAEVVLQGLLELPDFGDIIRAYRRIARRMENTAADARTGVHWKVLFLFHMMHIPGLAVLHEDVLRDLNRTLDRLMADRNRKEIFKLIDSTTAVLQQAMGEYPSTTLACVLSLGRNVYRSGDNELVAHLISRLVELEFQTPALGGVGNDWQIRVNPAHIQNIRVWMELIEMSPKWSTRLLSNLIVHLAVSGVFIKDTDLFGRDITRFLNSEIAPVYNLAKQLARLFPAYFNDIGAEGDLREISTRIDELCHRRDPLIHFLRKQSHVESSNQILDFMEATILFWATGDKQALAPYMPPNIFQEVETSGEFVDGVRQVIRHLSAKGVEIPKGLLDLDQERLESLISECRKAGQVDRQRVLLLAQFYKLLNQKYNLEFFDIHQHMEQLATEAFPDLDRLRVALAEPELKSRVFKLLDFMQRLKDLILSEKSYQVKEDIYKKRHFTVDIPSMYGSYHELKFDAMGLTLRLEALVNVLFEELIAGIDLSLITKATFYQIYDRLMLFDKALKIDGISSVELERQLDLLAHSLEVKGFSFTQYLDIFKGFAQAVKNIINDYFNNVHGDNLTRVLERLEPEQILAKYLPSEGLEDQVKLHHRVSEIFFRDRIAMSLGLQQLDLFLSRILNTLFNQSDKLPKDKLHLLLNYDPQRAMTSLEKPNSLATGIIYLGNKGLNLLKLKNLGLRIPTGFIITTEVFRCRDIIDAFPAAEQNFKEQVAQHIQEMERVTGKRFGDPQNPLLLSVRSGSSISQPGMMDTFLDVGINEEIAAGLAVRTGNPWFAWDCYRRFLQCFGMSRSMERDDFDNVISEFKRQIGIPLKRGFTGEQMRQVALAYKQLIQDCGHQVAEDPFQQLLVTIKSVLDSWESQKARTYRKIMGISDDWGTAVTVQAMVYGNVSENSGTGVIFTHNPRWSGDSLNLWGDFALGNQGEDVVAGLVQTLPISVKQQETEMRNTDITLETHFPEIYQAMRRWAKMLVYDKGWSPQEMEFTFESPSENDLYLLQSRDMAIRERKRVFTFSPESEKNALYLGSGIGVSGGAMSGRMVFSLEEVDHWRGLEPDTNLILVRGDTVPDDIKEIFAADGLLTARGGATSHAAVVAHRLGKTCVVGCGNMVCDEKRRIVRFGGTELKSGDYLSIDGRQGTVYQGKMKINETHSV